MPKLSAQQDEDGTGHSQDPGRTIQLFEPIPHDHSFCERVVINVSWTIFFIRRAIQFILLSCMLSAPLYFLSVLILVCLVILFLVWIMFSNDCKNGYRSQSREADFKVRLAEASSWTKTLCFRLKKIFSLFHFKKTTTPYPTNEAFNIWHAVRNLAYLCETQTPENFKNRLKCRFSSKIGFC